MAGNKINKINISGSTYDINTVKNVGVNVITSLANIPNTKDRIIAKLSGPTVFSVSPMNVGDSIEVVCIPSEKFTQPISGSNIKTTFDDDITTLRNIPFKLTIDCYKSGQLLVDAVYNDTAIA